MSVLVIDGLSVSYGHLLAVRNLSVSVEEHQVLGIIGPNGAGKSSTLRCLAGLVPAASGEVRFEGAALHRIAAEARARAGISLSAEGRKNFGPLSVADNLRLGAYPAGRIGAAEFGRRQAEIFELFPVLYERRAQKARTLSGGEAAMLSIAKAIMSSPRLLLLDEPTLGLAPRVSEVLFERINQLKSLIPTMVIVEQRAEGLLDVADLVLAMRNGERQTLIDAASVDRDSLNELYFGKADLPIDSSENS